MKIPTKEESLEWWKQKTNPYYRGNLKFRERKHYQRMERRRISPGSMIYYKYDAKYKSKLPFWDKNPLVIIFHMGSKHITGLNLHYIHPKFRPVLMMKIIKLNRLRIKKDRRFDLEYRDIKRFLIQYNLQISIRKYIKGRMAKVEYIKGSEWKYAAALPSEKFVFNGNMDRDKLYKLIYKTGKSGSGK